MTSTSSAGGWSAGTPFTAVYAFNGDAAGSYSSYVPSTIYGGALEALEFEVAGQAYVKQANELGHIEIANDVPVGNFLWDRYTVNAFGIDHPPLAAGLSVNFIQFDFFDWTGLCLADYSLVTSAAVLQSFGQKTGRIVFSNNEQSHFEISAVAPVPEPSTWALGASGLACLAWLSLNRGQKTRFRHHCNRLMSRGRLLHAVAATVAAVIAAAQPVSAGYLIDPTGGTVLWGDSVDVDDQTVRRSLGFTASLFGVPFTEVDVSTNGNLNFSASAEFTNSAFPTSTPMIAPLWDDLYIFAGTGEKITEKAVAGQYYSVTWDVSQFSNNVPRFQFQVVLFGGTTTIGGTTFLPDDIVFAYQRVDADFYGSNATVGLNAGDGTFSTLPSLVGAGAYLGDAQTSLLPTAPGSVLLARYDGSGYGGSLATAVVELPEPSTWAMGLVGLASIAWGAARKRSRIRSGRSLANAA